MNNKSGIMLSDGKKLNFGVFGDFKNGYSLRFLADPLLKILPTMKFLG